MCHSTIGQRSTEVVLFALSGYLQSTKSIDTAGNPVYRLCRLLVEAQATYSGKSGYTIHILENN